MYSDGGRFTCGTSPRSFAHCRSIRQARDAAQARPASISTTFNVGNRSNTPSKIMLTSSACWAWAWPTISSM
jgi:hypothetical protein